MKKNTLKTFDMADFLKTEEHITAYLNHVMADGDPDEIRHALGHVARARGMTKTARDSGLGRQSLYKSLGKAQNPRFGTIQRVLRSFGLGIKVYSLEAAAENDEPAEKAA